MIRYIFFLIFLFSVININAGLFTDPFNGANNTPLATYDTSYANARTSYNVNQLVLDGLGNVKLVSGAGSSGGFSYPKSGSQRNNGQISQMVLLPRNGAAVSNPYMRLLVQTTSGSSQYYGVEFRTSSSGNYSQYSWYRGSTAIGGMTSLSVVGTYSLESPLVVRLVTQMVSATVQRVTYYIGATESSLVEQSWIEVTNGSGMTDSSTSATDGTVPWSVGGWPGMLHHNNSSNLNALFTDFTDGISWNPSIPTVSYLRVFILGGQL